MRKPHTITDQGVLDIMEFVHEKMREHVLVAGSTDDKTIRLNIADRRLCVSDTPGSSTPRKYFDLRNANAIPDAIKYYNALM